MDSMKLYLNPRSATPCIDKGGQRRQLDEKPKNEMPIDVMITVLVYVDGSRCGSYDNAANISIEVEKGL